ncbi:putative protein [BD1-7 clade bacterium]|uniref:Serine aminopeptidase S33 domain-containing protein n=1 Tax=BD1-7 clade bacterium TaxID=2029982 RepID=A0A5S9QAJ0_9GAMM|nr:putative protein [BD1-7 clade bacterium]
MTRVNILRPLLVLACVWLAGCTQVMFYPSDKTFYKPEEKGYFYDDLTLFAFDGIELDAWLFPARTAGRKGVVAYFHGNSNNLSYHVIQAGWLTDEGYDVFMIDYRGFGDSQGEVDLANSLKDIRTSLRWLYAQYPDTPHFVYGQSLGAAMSGFVVATTPDVKAATQAVVLDSGFSAYPLIVQQVMSRNWLTWPVQLPASWLLPIKFNPVDVIADIAPVPLLIVHGHDDKLVEYSHAETLFAAAHAPKSLLSFAGGHNQAWLDEDNRQELLYFLANGKLKPEGDRAVNVTSDAVSQGQ